MKRHSNLSYVVAVCATFLVCAPLAIPVYVSATSTGSVFCSSLQAKADALNARLAVLDGKVTTAWSQQAQRLAGDEQTVDRTVTADREKADADRNADFAKLQARATTDAEKQAAAGYVTAVTDAITARRAAYDAARQAYRTSLKGVVDTQRSTTTGQIATFQDAVTAALNTAQTSCANAPASGPTIRSALLTSLQSARTNFQNDRQSDSKIGTEVKQLADTRNTAVRAADQTFEASITAARDALRQAFAISGGNA